MATATRGGVLVGGPLRTEQQLDSLRLLTAIMNKLEINRADVNDHPISLALQKSAILRWNGDFVFLTADAIDKLTHDDPNAAWRFTSKWRASQNFELCFLTVINCPTRSKVTLL